VIVGQRAAKSVCASVLALDQRVVVTLVLDGKERHPSKQATIMRSGERDRARVNALRSHNDLAATPSDHLMAS